MFRLPKGMIIMLSASGRRGVKLTAKRAYRNVKRLKISFSRGAKINPKAEENRGKKQNRGREPSISGRSRGLLFVSPVLLYSLSSSSIGLCSPP